MNSSFSGQSLPGLNSEATAREPITVSARDAARMLSISEKTLWSQTEPRGPIPAVRWGRRVLYAVDTLRRVTAEREAASRLGDSEV